MAPSPWPTTEPAAGLVAANSSVWIRSCSLTERPTTRGARASMTVVTPGEPKPSSYSLQPTTPSSVVILQKW